MELLKFIVNNVLGPVFDHDLVMVRARVDSEHSSCDVNSDLECQDKAEVGRRRRRQRWQGQASSSKHRNAGDAILDPSGPKLIEGFQNWILFYQIIGFINLPGVPLYLSIAYRIGAFTLAAYVMNTHFMFKILSSGLLNINFANPIFILMIILTLIVCTINIVVISHTSTFNLRPLFKILDTPRLCRVDRHTQDALGANTLKYMLVFFIYHSVLYRMMVHENFEQFISQFNMLEFLLEYYAATVYVYQIVGLAHVDFYVRSCFGAWLLALKTNLECRRARFNYLERRWPTNNEGEPSADHARPIIATPTAPTALTKTQPSRLNSAVMRQFCTTHLFVTLDDIQKSLNTMDDHLEVERSIQTCSLALINLLAFLGCGDHFLVAYDVLARANDYYHGTLLVLVSLNYIFLVMLTYLGDSFIYYALGKLVQTVEDEYFLQERADGRDDAAERARATRVASIETSTQERANDNLNSLASTVVTNTPQNDQVFASKQSLLIKRSDVLFCREFIVQFEDHLATAWSKLTFKAHLHIMGAFATLVAAKIIFDSH